MEPNYVAAKLSEGRSIIFNVGINRILLPNAIKRYETKTGK